MAGNSFSLNGLSAIHLSHSQTHTTVHVCTIPEGLGMRLTIHLQFDLEEILNQAIVALLSAEMMLLLTQM